MGFETLEDRLTPTAIPTMGPNGLPLQLVQTLAVNLATHTVNTSSSLYPTTDFTFDLGEQFVVVARNGTGPQQPRIATNSTGLADAEYIRYNRPQGPSDVTLISPFADVGIRLNGVGEASEATFWGAYQSDHQYVRTATGLGQTVQAYYKGLMGSGTDNSGMIYVDIYSEGPVASNDEYLVASDSTLSVASSGILANDIRGGGTAITAQLVSGPVHGSLTFNSNGSFDYTPDAGYYGLDSFTYLATNGNNNSNVASVTIGVHAVLMADQTMSIDENSGVGTVVGSVATGGYAPNKNFTIVGGNEDGFFAIDSLSGEIRTLSADLNYEGMPAFADRAFSITIQVTDYDIPALTSSGMVTIIINDVNEEPTATGQTLTIRSSMINGSIIGIVSSSDPDFDQTLTYSITSGNDGNISSINPTTGSISIDDVSQIDFESTDPFSLVIRVEDNGNPSLSSSTFVSILLEEESDSTTESERLIELNTLYVKAVASLFLVNPNNANTPGNSVELATIDTSTQINFIRSGVEIGVAPGGPGLDGLSNEVATLNAFVNDLSTYVSHSLNETFKILTIAPEVVKLSEDDAFRLKGIKSQIDDLTKYLARFRSSINSLILDAGALVNQLVDANEGVAASAIKTLLNTMEREAARITECLTKLGTFTTQGSADTIDTLYIPDLNVDSDSIDRQFTGYTDGPTVNLGVNTLYNDIIQILDRMGSTNGAISLTLLAGDGDISQEITLYTNDQGNLTSNLDSLLDNSDAILTLAASALSIENLSNTTYEHPDNFRIYGIQTDLYKLYSLLNTSLNNIASLRDDLVIIRAAYPAEVGTSLNSIIGNFGLRLSSIQLRMDNIVDLVLG